jgi:hypothetical protein
MTADDRHVRHDTLNYSATLARLRRLRGREVLVQLRVGDMHGPFRLAARGVLVGEPPGQAGLTDRRELGDDVEAFRLDTGGFLAVREADFVRGEWHAGDDEAELPSQPHLNLVFADSVVQISVLWRHDAATGWPTEPRP